MAQYLKPDSELGYIEDTAEIEFLKFNNLRHSILGCMLGDFDDLGAYVVSPEIVKELISMEKYVVQAYDNIELCRSTLKLDKQISFMVTYEGNKATLSLVEKLNYEANFMLNSGTYSNINEYVLDSVETSGEVNRNMLYMRWNIKSIPGNIVDIFNCDDVILEKYFGIVNRFKFLLKANSKMLQKEVVLENIESAYANAVLDILQRYPKLKVEVINNIKETLSEKKDSVSVKKPFFAKTFNEVLDNAIQKNLEVLNKQEKEDFIQEKRTAIVELNINRQNIFELEQVEMEKDGEYSPKIFQIKSSHEDQRKSLIDLAQELVRENKIATSRVSGGEASQYESALFRRTILAVSEKKGNVDDLPEEIKKMPVELDEKEKLVENLIKEGLGDLIRNPEKQETKAEEKITKTDKKVTADAKKTNNNKKVESKAKKSGGNKKSSSKKTDKKKKEEKAEKKEEQGKTDKEEKRLLSESYFKNNKTASENKSSRETQTEDITILSNAELETINQKINQTSSRLQKPSEKVEVVKVDFQVKVNNQEGVDLLKAENEEQTDTIELNID